MATNDAAYQREYMRAYRSRMTKEEKQLELEKARERNSNRDKQAVADSVRAWRTKYPERYRAARRTAEGARRARKRGAFIEQVRPDVVIERHGGHCGICGEKIEGAFHVDHVIPLSKGGSHGYSNVQPAHPVCNLKKGCQTPLYP